MVNNSALENMLETLKFSPKRTLKVLASSPELAYQNNELLKWKFGIRNWVLHRLPAGGPVSSKRLLSPSRQGPANVLALHDFQQNKVYCC